MAERLNTTTTAPPPPGAAPAEGDPSLSASPAAPPPDSPPISSAPSAAGIVLFALILFSLQVAGALAFPPGGLLWGITLFGFLPLPFLIAYGCFMAAALWYCLRGDIAGPLQAAAQFVESWKCPALLCLLFAAGALLFRVRVPLLGDAYTLTNNIENTLNGDHPLGLWNEPLAIFFLFATAKILGARAFPDIMNAIALAEVLLGWGFIASSWHTIRLLFPARGDIRKFPALLFLVTLPVMQLFLGYAESYGVVLFMLSCTLLVTLLFLKGKIPFWMVLTVFVLQAGVHYLGVLLLPLLIHLGLIEYRRSRLRRLFPALLLAGALAGGLIAGVAGWDIARLLPEHRHSHILPLAGAGRDGDTPYTIFSPYHALDLLNLVLLSAPGTLFLLAAVPLNAWWKRASSPFQGALIRGSIPFLLFLLVAKFDLGMAKDWDVAAPYWLILALLALSVLSGSEARLRIFCAVIAVTLPLSLGYFQLNATASASSRRVESMMDARIMPQSGWYQTSFHLSMYRLERREFGEMTALWRNYVTRFPSDDRGYEKLARSYWEMGERGYDSLLEAYERRLQLDSAGTSIPKPYADMCLLIGAAYQKGNRIPQALSLYRKAISLEPRLAAAYNNIGLVFFNQGRLDSAHAWYSRAIMIDSSYVAAYRNLGNVYLAAGTIDSAILVARTAIRLAPPGDAGGGYELLAGAYQAAGRTQEAIGALQQAARLGSVAAQQRLLQNGVSW